MHPAVQAQLYEEGTRFAKVYRMNKCVSPDGGEIIAEDFIAEYNEQLAHIVIAAGNLITNAQKLRYLHSGQSTQEEREKTIRAMIEVDHIHPDMIIHPWQATALQQSIFEGRLDFAKYLISQGATY